MSTTAKIDLSRLLLPIIGIALVINGICLYLIKFSGKYGLEKVDFGVVLWGNVIVAILSLISISLHYITFQKNNPQAFTRSVMAGTFLKLIVVMITVLIYVSVTGKDRNVPGVIVCMGLYILYTFLEVMTTARLNKRKNGNS